MKTQAQRDRAKFEQWKATKHFTAVQQVENDETFIQRTGIEGYLDDKLKELKERTYESCEVVGFFTYEDSATIVMDINAKFYAFKHDSWGVFENAEEKLWREQSSKNVRTNIETLPFEETLTRVIGGLHNACLTPKEMMSFVFADMVNMLDTMVDNDVSFEELYEIAVQLGHDYDDDELSEALDKYIDDKKDVLDCMGNK